MSVRQTLLDFRVPPDIASSRDKLIEKISKVLNQKFDTGNPILSSSGNGKPMAKMDVYVGRNNRFK